jgi:internalin A
MVASEAEGRAEALRRIAACHAAQADELDLGGLQLTALDGEILTPLCELTWLRRLFLGPSVEARESPELAFIDGRKNVRACNALGVLPNALFDALTQVVELDLALNRLRGLPASIGKLTALTSLDLFGSEIGLGVRALKGLAALATLDLSRNKIGPEGAQALKSLTALTYLDLSGNEIGPKGAQVLKGLVTLTSLGLSHNQIGPDGAQALKGLVALTSLDLFGNEIGPEGAEALEGLAALTSLNLSGNRIGDKGAQALARLVALTNLDLSGNLIGDEGAQALKGLASLTRLELSFNQIGPEGARALEGLVALTRLDLRGNKVGPEGAHALDGLSALTYLELSFNHLGDEGAQALKGLAALTSLALSGNRIGDDGAQAVEGLVALTSLDLSGNQIGDKGAQALKGLVALTSLGLSQNEIGPGGAQALKDLAALRSLRLSKNRIGDKGAHSLTGLAALTSLDLSDNEIGSDGAQALKDLAALISLNLSRNDIGPEGVHALKGLTALTNLDLSNNEIGDVSALVSLRNLRKINLSGCGLVQDTPAFWGLPCLQEAVLHDASLPGVPVEMLSKHNYDNCLPRLRAHLADLSGEDDVVSDVKLMILGNGRVGKTQICRRLRGERFDEAVPSTHGVQLSSAALAPDALGRQATLKIWDFGGQEIYHGTHALFLKSRALFPIVWTPRSEAERSHIHGGFTFRNRPLGYWLAYVRAFGGPRSPVLVIQSQCDRPEDEREAPLPPDALDAFVYKKRLQYSARFERGRGALDDALRDAVQWMRGDQPLAKIGPGRAAVKAELEALLASGQRLVSHQGYLELCAEVERAGKGRISAPELLLDYLHDTGAVFYREGLFGDQIILDQAWALDAVYAVFDRASLSFKKIERNHGRFRRSELAEWVWGQHGAAEQELFLSFMEQCGICFKIVGEDREKRVEAEYIAPDLLPGRVDAETEAHLKLAWDEAEADAEAVLTFALLPPGLMRALIARIGGHAGLAAEYWRDGVCFYDKQTGSRALIEQRWTEGWAGEVRIAVKRGQSDLLLQRLIKLIENDRISLGARPSGKIVKGVEPRAGVLDGAEGKGGEALVRPAHEPSAKLEYYVSYAWGDDTEEGEEREGLVDRLCQAAEARHKVIIRDKAAMKIGDRISIFMDRIGKGAVNGRVCIVLSEKYLKSAYCMHELFDVWRHCREDGAAFVERTRVFVLPSAKISTPIERAQYVIHWQARFKETDALVKKHGQFVLSDKDNAEFRLMSRFVSETANVLQLVQDILRPRSFDDYVSHVFD